MEHIAAELGVSGRTLQRYYPTKASIVWGAIDSSFQELHRNLERADPGLPLMPALAEAIVRTIADGSGDPETDRARLRLIATTPELHSNNSGPFREWRRQISEFVAARTGATTDDLLTQSTAAAAQAAIMTALTWWATAEREISPADAVRRAVTALGSRPDPDSTALPTRSTH